MLALNDCGGYTGAACINESCSCLWTIQNDECIRVETYLKDTIIVGVVFGVVFLICVSIIAFLLYRNFRKTRLIVKNDDCFDIPEISYGVTRYSPVTKVLTIKPVEIQLLANHVDEMLKDDGLKLRNEFLSLNKLVTCSETTDAKHPQNLEKNRSSIVPYNFNRVKLADNSGSHIRNYINASHVLQNNYIITQFPQRRTMTHFWKMIWAHNTTNIIMVTPLNEMKKSTARKVCVFGDLNVTLQATFMFGARMKIRTFALSQNKNRRRITHFHIYALDHLSLAKECIENIRCIRSNVHFQRKTGPTVVHSGSGVEWSGVFVLVDYLIQKIENGEKTIDIPADTLQLLDERKSSITEKHYELVYSCIRKYLKLHTTTKRNIVDEQEGSISNIDDYEELP
uniref:Receptor-type tyrosine-protein phosphatase alpha-like isoform X3 n=1 Tax=Crassostrea virginica TaxID=6565 RepID=A0A8B8AP25_CRAVI|nr:receptor-type tyrosine-protein phosphatase alpha-like isoform X3 [Crassostrea virginica]